MQKESRSKGIFISYVVIAIRMLSQFFLIKIYLVKLGLDGYGFYQYVYSIASYATILDFGISSIVNKNIVESLTINDKKGLENKLFLCLAITSISVLVIVIISLLLRYNAASIFTISEYHKILVVRQLMTIMLINLSCLVIEHFFEGILMAFDRFVTLKTVALLQILMKIGFIVLLLFTNYGVISIALGEMFSIIVCTVFLAYYSFFKLKVKIHFYYFDRIALYDNLKLAYSICLQSVVIYFNNGIDKFVLGKLIDEAAVSIYSIAVLFANAFDDLPSVISQLYLPSAVEIVTRGATGDDLTKFVIKPGRYQFVVCGYIFSGFLLFGRSLISLWYGKETMFAWVIAILLMAGSIIPLVQNALLPVLTAKNKRSFRSYTLFIAALLNLILTVILVKKYGIVGAPIGTTVALILCNNIIMNIYYKKVIHINLKMLFSEIFKGTLFAIFIALTLSFPLTLFHCTNLIHLILVCIMFSIIYFASIWLIGFNIEEKKVLLNLVKSNI